MTTNLHDKMLAAIDAYFSASNEIEAHIAEEQLLDVRAEIRKQKDVPETNFGNMAEPKIGCVNHDCDQCKAVQEPVAQDVQEKCRIETVPAKGGLLPTPPAPQPVPVKTYHDGKPWPVAPVPNGPYSAPIKELWPVAPKPWVGLTDDERLEVAEIDGADEWFWKVCKAIEAKLKEKNA
jgi:hypothetical protein